MPRSLGSRLTTTWSGGRVISTEPRNCRALARDGARARELASLALAHAVSILLVTALIPASSTRSHFLGLELILTCAAWWPSRVYIRSLLWPMANRLPTIERRIILAASVFLGLFTLAWWP